MCLFEGATSKILFMLLMDFFLFLEPVGDQWLFDLQVWIFHIEVLGRFGLLHAICMMPVQNLDLLPLCCHFLSLKHSRRLLLASL